MSTNNTAPGQLFDLKQRGDGAWVVWTRKSQAELGLVSRETVEAARGTTFTDEGWSAFLSQPHLTEPTVWVIAQVYEARPTVETVLNLLGVKRKPRTEGTARKDTRPQARRQPKPQAQEAVAA